MKGPFQHAGLKLFSLALAIVLWMAVSGEETVERGLRVSLELQQFPPELELASEPPSSVDVRVRGASGTLSRVSAAEIIAVLDLRGTKPGRRLFHLTPEQVRAPFGVEVVQVVPATVALVFESSAARQVPVVPAVEGKPAPGYVVGKAIADPATVEVVGPESAVERATEAMTETVNVTGARAPVQQNVTVGLLDPTLRLKNGRTVTVTVQVQPAPLERTMRDRPIHLRNLTAHLAAQAVPPIADVVVRGSREAMNLVEPDDVTAYVDLAGLGVGDYSLTVYADVSTDAGATRIEPATVQVRISGAKD